MGFNTYSTACIFKARWAYSKSSTPEKMISFISGIMRISFSPSSSPFMKGIITSVMTTSGRIDSAISNASRPFSALPMI